MHTIDFFQAEKVNIYYIFGSLKRKMAIFTPLKIQFFRQNTSQFSSGNGNKQFMPQNIASSVVNSEANWKLA